MRLAQVSDLPQQLRSLEPVHYLAAFGESPQFLSQQLELLERLCEGQHLVAVLELHRLLLDGLVLAVVEGEGLNGLGKPNSFVSWILHGHGLLVGGVEVKKDVLRVLLDLLLQTPRDGVLKRPQLRIEGRYLFRGLIGDNAGDELLGIEVGVKEIAEDWIHDDEFFPVLHDI